jgi:hypothetical protein
VVGVDGNDILSGIGSGNANEDEKNDELLVYSGTPL